MIKKISAMKARQTLGQLMNEVSIRNDQYIIERNGKALAALVPVEFLNYFQQRKKEFFEIIDKAHQNVGNVSEEEIQADIEEAIREVRKQQC